jgi:hypothetical protein
MTGDFAHGFRVDGEPLGFYHFTGFDSGAHRIMAIKNAAASPAVQQLIAWYEREIAVAERDPISEWPWAFGRFADGTPIEAGHRWLYRESPDLRQAFPDPYAVPEKRMGYLGWCNTEGKLRYPDVLSEHGARRFPFAPRLRSRVSFPATLRLVLLLLSPRSGKALRARCARVLRSEGLGGMARRLQGRRG